MARNGALDWHQTLKITMNKDRAYANTLRLRIFSTKQSKVGDRIANLVTLSKVGDRSSSARL
jgi:hypothetical protein